MCYNFYRYYDPQTGSYISQDPIGLAGGGQPV
nr:RHS repeat-associated core domain-containing protein [Serratia rubidaea]